MTIGTQINTITVDGNGVTTSFVYPFNIPAASDAVVTYTSTTGVETVLTTSEYTISGLGNSTGGTVTYPLSGSPIAAGTSLTIQRVLPLVQTTSLSGQGPTFASIENALDYLTMCIQQVAGTGALSFQAPPTDPPGLNYIAPAVAERANQTLGFDGSGNLIVGAVATAVVSTAMQPVVAASTVGGAFTLIAASGGVVGGALELASTLGGGGSASVGGNLVSGMKVQSLAGGFVFPDGSVQTTAASGGSSGATPSTLINGPVVAGVASTFMRSDATPGLMSTGVTASTYGSASQIAQITVDGYGRVTAAANVNFSGLTTYLAVGSSVTAQYRVEATPTIGSSYSGSTLYNAATGTSLGAIGTWQCRGVTAAYFAPCCAPDYCVGSFYRTA